LAGRQVAARCLEGARWAVKVAILGLEAARSVEKVGHLVAELLPEVIPAMAA